jgi:hypothetical protein
VSGGQKNKKNKSWPAFKKKEDNAGGYFIIII